MKVGIHKVDDPRHHEFANKYYMILEMNGIPVIWLDVNDVDFWDRIKELDYFIYRWSHWDDHQQIANSILPVIEHFHKIRCFPDYATCWHFDDKIKQYYLLQSLGFPIAKSWVFWDKQKALGWINSQTFPVVFKLKGGAGSYSLLLVNHIRQEKKLIMKMFTNGFQAYNVKMKGSLTSSPYRMARRIARNLRNRFESKENPYWAKHKNYVLFQKFMPGNNYDTRVTIIGDRAFAFRRFNRKNDFRSSGSGLIDYQTSAIDHRFIKTAFEISKALGFQSMAYDFLWDEDLEPVICEISYTYMDTAVHECPGYWDPQLNFHEGNLWPQYCQLADLLGIPDLKKVSL